MERRLDQPSLREKGDLARKDVVVTHNVQSQKTGASHDVDHSAQHALHSEVQKGFVTINAWLRARDYPSMPLPSVCGYSPMMTRVYELCVWFLGYDVDGTSRMLRALLRGALTAMAWRVFEEGLARPSTYTSVIDLLANSKIRLDSVKRMTQIQNTS